MDEGSVVLDTFQSEIVTDDTDDEEEDDNGDIRDPLLTSTLVDAVTRLAETELRPYPAPDTQIFSSFVDKIMGVS